MNEKILELFQFNVEDYNRNFYNISNAFFIPKKLLGFYQNSQKQITEVEIKKCFNAIALSILNQIDLLIGQRISHFVSLSKTLDEFKSQVGASRYENLRLALYEEIKYRSISNNFPEFFNKISLIPNSISKSGQGRDFATIENYLSPVATALIINSSWHKLSIPEFDKVKTFLDNSEEKTKQSLDEIKNEFKSEFNKFNNDLQNKIDTKEDKLNPVWKKFFNENIKGDYELGLKSPSENGLFLNFDPNDTPSIDIMGEEYSTNMSAGYIALNSHPNEKMILSDNSLRFEKIIENDQKKKAVLNLDNLTSILEITKKTPTIEAKITTLENDSKKFKEIDIKLEKLLKDNSQSDENLKLSFSQFKTEQIAINETKQDKESFNKFKVEQLAENEKIKADLTTLNNANQTIVNVDKEISDLKAKCKNLEDSLNAQLINGRLLKGLLLDLIEKNESALNLSFISEYSYPVRWGQQPPNHYPGEIYNNGNEYHLFIKWISRKPTGPVDPDKPYFVRWKYYKIS
ncbi:hypothetical protein [Metamycoplasma hyosynoviae]|uniref:hypothetical protein n=1 Tax=Metamycoplasma hyosynoviae TaxID=29559 RepID=UPI002362FA29|nr:hypothetical protein [Metamycoplasma hyosynoviae]MDD1373912.1 hypothetical protein [Metamycoplasma hyosynoviae]MDD1375392.1 hypothetical protein [Metamycoplasma hyosynoviae]MDD1376389.1 hypothetical protein [Metamycoplasma hyosynoviae]MDD1377012.1 hypothetical protein [Metamycoplasma hyosynoviae]